MLVNELVSSLDFFFFFLYTGLSGSCRTPAVLYAECLQRCLACWGSCGEQSLSRTPILCSALKSGNKVTDTTTTTLIWNWRADGDSFLNVKFLVVHHFPTGSANCFLFLLGVAIEACLFPTALSTGVLFMSWLVWFFCVWAVLGSLAASKITKTVGDTQLCLTQPGIKTSHVRSLKK